MTSRRSSRAMLVVIVPLTIIGAFMYGFVSSERQLPFSSVGYRMMTWAREVPVFGRAFNPSTGSRVQAADLQGSWHRIVRAGPGQDRLTGVTVYDPDLADKGLNLITSGHGQEAVLMDMEGRALHTWRYEYKDALPRAASHSRSAPRSTGSDHFWRCTHLFENGDLLAIYDGLAMIKLDRHSDLVWAVSGGYHSDVFVDETGLIYVLAREAKVIPGIQARTPVLEDFIVVLGGDGRVLRKVSLLEAFERSLFASFLGKMPGHGDLFQTNAVQVLDGSHAATSPVFRRGNILISVPSIDVIAIVDMDEGRVVWALSGQWVAQHAATLLENGNILLFDSKGRRGMSKVIEVAPFTQKIVWAYEGTAENTLYTESGGTAYRLPGGNTLIVDSGSGRAFEVTPRKQVVWEYYNPHRAGDSNDFIATLFDIVRLDPAYVAGWLKPTTDR